MDIKEYTANEEIVLTYHNNFTIKYGIANNNIDVTGVCRDKCIDNEILTIPSGDHERAAIFGDPIPYVLKSIFIEFNSDKNKLNKSVGISLGLDCSSAIWGTQNGYREKKLNNYMTCPFDIIFSTQEGIIECLRDDFKYFTDIDYIELVKHGQEDVIIHKKYGFCFNHESPGHAELYKTENWKFGKTHFIDNNYKYFIERYKKRIQNFRNYIYSGCFIYFLTTAPNTKEIKKVIDYKYPFLRYEIITI